jgi:hypothetical protein
MTSQELLTKLADNDKEYLKFDRVPNKRSNRPDLHAFILLDELVPGKTDIVCSATHDEIFLDTDLASLAAVITDEQIVELIRCGVRGNPEYDCLAMFT